MPTKVPCLPLNFGMAAGIFIKMSRYSTVAMCYWLKPPTVPPGRELRNDHSYLENRTRRRKKVIYKVIEHCWFSTKRDLMDIYVNNRTVKTCICFFMISYTVMMREIMEWVKITHKMVLLGHLGMIWRNSKINWIG